MVRKLCFYESKAELRRRSCSGGASCQNLGLTQHFRLLIVIPPPKPFIPPRRLRRRRAVMPPKAHLWISVRLE